LSSSPSKQTLTPRATSGKSLNIVLQALRANDLLQNRKYNEAKELCDHLINAKTWPLEKMSVRVLLLNVRGHALQMQGLLDPAIADYQQVRQIDPNNLLAIECLADIYKTVNKLDLAKECYDQIIAIDPEKSFLNYGKRGELLLRQNDSKESIADLEMALSLQPENASTLHNAAIAYLAQKNYEQALICCEKLLHLNPKSGVAFSQQAKAKIGLGKRVEAMDDLTRALEYNHDPDNATRRLRMLLCIENKEDETAVADCDMILKSKPNDRQVLFFKAIALGRLEKYSDAEETFELALKHSTTGAQKAEIYYNMSLRYTKSGDTAAALRYVDLAIQEDKNTVLARNNRAFILTHIGRAAEGLADIEKAVKSDQKSANTLSTRGCVYYHLNRLEEAKKDFDQALAWDPEIGEAHYFRGCILRKMGLTAEAAADLKRAEELNFKFPIYSTLGRPSFE